MSNVIDYSTLYSLIFHGEDKGKMEDENEMISECGLHDDDVYTYENQEDYFTVTEDDVDWLNSQYSISPYDVRSYFM